MGFFVNFASLGVWRQSNLAIPPRLTDWTDPSIAKKPYIVLQSWVSISLTRHSLGRDVDCLLTKHDRFGLIVDQFGANSPGEKQLFSDRSDPAR